MPSFEIVEAAKEIDADLIVIATQVTLAGSISALAAPRNMWSARPLVLCSWCAKRSTNFVSRNTICFGTMKREKYDETMTSLVSLHPFLAGMN